MPARLHVPPSIVCLLNDEHGDVDGVLSALVDEVDASDWTRYVENS